MERVFYARILVEVDASKPLVDTVEFIFPNGITRKQSMGTQPVIAGAAPVKPAVQVHVKKAQPANWTLVQRRHKRDNKSNAPQVVAGQPKPATVVPEPTLQPTGKDIQPQPEPSRQQHVKEDCVQQMPSQRPEKVLHTETVRSDSEDESHSFSSTQHFMPTGSSTAFMKPNDPKQKQKNNQLCLLGILETKLSASAVPRILNRSFPGWCHTDNFHTISDGRMLIIWNPAVIDVQPEDISLDSNPVWCKLDRVLLNNEWLEAGLQCNAHFSPPGCLSDHSPGIIPLFDPRAPKPKPFRFFNMWAEHLDFLAAIEAGWNMNVEGTPQFGLCRKLKALKRTLKSFNSLHYSHISIRAKQADLALQEAQLQLETNPGDAALQDRIEGP
ncbi:hypothetical protein Salat_2145600 [Sesamum alatum]|uniref:Endonuclease/exonuclease/phosphatase domain-containing protein n=1 Tax=Sesamum alatum TaxID=300844 RepID=A0AAE1Y2B9_9LAMI|nr:hypothetical protein Salat_2145600 [Sesamum alatum]